MTQKTTRLYCLGCETITQHITLGYTINLLGQPQNTLTRCIDCQKMDSMPFKPAKEAAKKDASGRENSRT